MKSKDTSWNDVADWYDDLFSDADSYQREVILPNLVRIAGDVRGKKVLDIASGQGFFSHAFAKAGAEVAGVEISPKLADIAREHATNKEIFYAGSAEKLPNEIKSGAFDVCLCVLACQNIQKLDAVISEASRALVHGGRFLIVLNHPAFRIPKRSEWGFDPVVDFGIAEQGSARGRRDTKIHYGVDESHAVQYRRMNGYMSESSEHISMHPGKSPQTETVSFHRPLQLYFKSFSKHHFAVERLEEWISHKTSEKGPRKVTEDSARKEFPLFLYLGLVKNS